MTFRTIGKMVSVPASILQLYHNRDVRKSHDTGSMETGPFDLNLLFIPRPEWCYCFHIKALEL